MRMFQAGTGRGHVLGTAQIKFYANDERTVDGFAVQWDGELRLIPALPGLAFDQELPMVRSIDVEGERLVGEVAQRYFLQQFEDWVAGARDSLTQGDSLPLHEGPRLRETSEEPAARAFFTVRTNTKKQRLWGEATYLDPSTRNALTSLINRVIWDWAITRDPKRENGVMMLRLLDQQLAHYRAHGIPSGFGLREIGTAPYAAWHAVPMSGSQDSPS